GSYAKWLRVPSGRTPRAIPLPARTEATAFIVPSPPPARIARGLFFDSFFASAIASAPLDASSTSGSAPAARKCAFSCARSRALRPGPARLLMMTGKVCMHPAEAKNEPAGARAQRGERVAQVMHAEVD